jgi:DNA ligase-1
MFTPMLAPNEKIDVNAIQYPLLASIKMDGIRCLFRNGDPLTRSLKNVPNIQLKEKFEEIRKYSEVKGWTLDGEIYSPNVPFQLIQSCVMTEDCTTKEAAKKWAKLCAELKIEMTREYALAALMFHCFDVIRQDDLNEPFSSRSLNILKLNLHNLIQVQNKIVNSAAEVWQMFEETQKKGEEGLILRDPASRYKCGRGTVKEGLIYKVKPWETYDARIIGVVQATVAREGSEVKINELGRSVTSKKQEDRVLIEKASCFLVIHDGKELKVSIAQPDEIKKEIWANQKSYIGRMIEYVGMAVGAKDLPRHCEFKGRYREDKD